MKVNDSVKREILYNIVTEFSVPMKLLRLIKMCLKKHGVKSAYVNICQRVFVSKMA
jgi:hypothetical protein